jgi:acid phosphatase type 7
MKRIILLLLLSIAFLGFGYSQEPDNETFAVTHGPWLQNLSSTGVTIIWITNKSAVPGVYVTGPDGKSILVRNSHDGFVDAGGTLHKVRVEGLMPSTSYKYKLNSVQILKFEPYNIFYGDTTGSKVFSFVTPAVKSEKVSFTVINDVHEMSGKMGSYLRHNDINAQEFYFFNGDMVSFLQAPEQLYRGFLDTAVFYFASVKPFMYIRGNHETRGYRARDLKDWFDFPGDRFYYSFDRGPVHFIVLDGGEDKPDNNRYYYGLADYDAYRKQELEWLKGEVKTDEFRKAKYRIVMVHMPVPNGTAQNYSMNYMSANFAPLLRDAGINLMISAHTHKNSMTAKDATGIGYPVLVNSNESFLEVTADQLGIKATIKDASGKTIFNYNFN